MNDRVWSVAGGRLLFLDAANAPRFATPIAGYRADDGYSCARFDRAGTLVLVAGDPPPQRNPQQTYATATPGYQALSGCCLETTAILYLRASPAGVIKGAVLRGTALKALRRGGAWFEVAVDGLRGWISADYVTISGACGG